MEAYKEIIRNVLKHGQFKKNRTGVDTLSVTGVMFEHDMADGFPLLTTKYVPLRVVAVELEGFINGITDKKWFQDRGCHIWDEWCNPLKVPYGHEGETRERMAAERDLGPIYGFQWRHFGGHYVGHTGNQAYGGVDQLKNLVNTLKTNPNDRRLVVSSWNPLDLCQMALPPCHYSFQVTVSNGRLNLLWSQRSVDVALGLPFNIASYGLLLTLLAKESGFEPGRLVGFLGDTHIYEDHIDGLGKQLDRMAFKLPTLQFNRFSSVFEWWHNDCYVDQYLHHPAIKFDIAI